MGAPESKEKEFIFLTVTPKQFQMLLLSYSQGLARKQRDFVRCEILETAIVEALGESDVEQRDLTRLMLTMANGGAKCSNGWWVN